MGKVLQFRHPKGRLPAAFRLRGERHVGRFHRLLLKMPLLPLALVIGIAGGLVVASVIPAPDEGAEVGGLVGRAFVLDGDTVEINGTRIRFHGIDAPESRQTCRVAEHAIPCGRRAALALAGKIGSRYVACEGRTRDRYGRVVAVCRADGEDLNAWMVAEGWALAYRRDSTDYVRQEQSASADKRGLWQGEFVAPWEWRRGKRLQSQPS